MKLSTLWPYSYEDKTTWKFIDHESGENKRTRHRFIRKWFLNADFRFKEMDKNWKRDSRVYEMRTIKEAEELELQLEQVA